MKLGPNQKRWLEALRSGSYAQTSGFLHTSEGYCCLGVACDLFKTEETMISNHGTRTAYDHDEELAPDFVLNALALHSGSGDPLDSEDFGSLVDLNDGGNSFTEIASVIEAYPEQYFTESR